MEVSTVVKPQRAGVFDQLRDHPWFLILIVAVMIAVVVAGVYVFTAHSGAGVVQSAPTGAPADQVTPGSTEANTSQNPPVAISSANSSDAQLDQDLQSLDSQVNWLDGNLDDVNSSLSDQQTDLGAAQ